MAARSATLPDTASRASTAADRMTSRSGADAGQPSPAPWPFRDDADTLGRPTILVVEDDADIREMLGMLFDLAGFTMLPCGTAEAGLGVLRQRSVDVVLTDYALPYRSGVWLLREAAREGLLESTPVFIVTAHPHVEGGEGFEIIQKPFDLDDLVARLRQRMQASPAEPPRVPRAQRRARATKRSAIDSNAPVSSRRSRAKQKRM